MDCIKRIDCQDCYEKEKCIKYIAGGFEHENDIRRDWTTLAFSNAGFNIDSLGRVRHGKRHDI